MADALASGASGSNTVWVQVPSPALIFKAVNTVEILYLSYFFVFGVLQNVCKNVYTFLHVKWD